MTFINHGSAKPNSTNPNNDQYLKIVQNINNQSKSVGGLDRDLRTLNEQYPNLSAEKIMSDKGLAERVSNLLSTRYYCWGFIQEQLGAIPKDAEETVKNVLSCQGQAVLTDLESLLDPPKKFHAQNRNNPPYGFAYMHRMLVSAKINECDDALKKLASTAEKAYQKRELRIELQHFRNEFHIWKAQQQESLVIPIFNAKDTENIASIELRSSELLRKRLGWNQNFGNDPRIHPLGSFLRDLQTIIDSRKNFPLTTEVSKAIDKQFILAMPNSSLADRIDGVVYDLAPEPKGGPNWGTYHRYEDLARLKQAILRATFEDFDSWLNTDSELADNDEAQQNFYHCLSEKANAKNVTDAKKWAKQHLAYHLPLIYPALEHAYKLSTGDFLLLNEVPLYPSSEQAPANKELELSLDSSTTIKQLKAVNREIDFTQKSIENVSKTKDLFPSNQSKMIEVFKEEVKKTVQQLPENVRNNLYKRVWDLSKETRTNEDQQWGKNHYMDDLKILQQAIIDERESLKLLV